ncbi:Uridine phosphorylase 2 [Geodia barretti]|uniref:Uridine phosphorylase 2 n=1 Tax=Geodia barretti TaxID=519541 RepID=A0AA35T3T6_GEOBA|nr:Uridine phosphorylase 2 [Geodia barretti]
MDDEKKAHSELGLPNPYLNSLDGDFLYHLGYSSLEARNGFTKDGVSHSFQDVKFVVMGGSSGRMRSFAEVIAREINHPVQTAEQLDIHRTDRYAFYKIGPVLSVSHGMGVPSITILLHEITKLLSYAGAKDAVLIRIGTSGGIGVPPGTVVITDKTFNGFLKEEHELVVLGERKVRPAVIDQELARAIQSSQSDARFQTVLGGTMCTDDFFEGQGRVDGAVCEHSDEQKMDFLRRAHSCGVVNIEMECTAMSSLCRLTGYKCAAVCVALLDRLKGDQVKIQEEEYKSFGMRPQSLVASFIKSRLSS